MADQKIHGELFSKEEADAKYGPVLDSYKLKVGEFKDVLGKTTQSIMFLFKDGKTYVFDKDRNIIHKNGDRDEFSKAIVLKRYSVSVVEELLAKGATTVDAADNSVIIEQRADVISVSYGSTTMEVGSDCPPWCTD
jgi:hypothetical protein